MKTIAPGTPLVFRTYLVEVGTDSMCGYKERRVVLRYTLEEADALDPNSPQAIKEVERRAVKLEKRDQQERWLKGESGSDLPEPEFVHVGEVKLARMKLVTK